MESNKPLNYLLLEGEEEHVNFRDKFDRYLYNWKWFVWGVVIAIVLSVVYLKITPKQYRVSTTILVEENKNGETNSELSTFQDLGLLKGTKKSVDNEMGLLNSRNLMTRVIKYLNLNVSYYALGTIPKKEIFKDEIPFKINFFPKGDKFFNLDISYKINILSTNSFTFEDKKNNIYNQLDFGESIPTVWGSFTITPTVKTKNNIGKEIGVIIKPLNKTVQSYLKLIKVALLYKKTGLIEISIKQPNFLKAKTILNKLVEEYNNNGIEKRKLIATNTDKFIDSRLKIIKGDLTAIDKGVEQFKTSNRLSNISTEANLTLKSNTILESKIVDLNTQIKLAAYVTDYISKASEELIPADLGLKNASISNNSLKYNELLFERNRLLKSSGRKNPVIVNLEGQLLQLRTSLKQSLTNLTSSLQIALDAAKKQERRLNSKIAIAPKQEREFNDIQRQQKIISSLYLYLLQKREENAIKLAATDTIAKVVDVAGGSNKPVSPKTKIILLIGLLVGLIIPFLILYVKFLLDNKVRNINDIEAKIKVTILGNIPKEKIEQQLVVNKTNTSSIAESFRLARTMLNFILPNDKKGGKSIFVTSTIAGEGKTFIAINLASVLALSNKKVLLLGADIRKPKIKEYLNLNFDKELKNILDDELNISKGIKHYNEGDFDIIDSSVLALNASVLPLNPSDLLLNGRFEHFLDFGIKNYDYVIVDSPPVKLVTDAIQLGKNADLFVYVVRANYLDKRLLEIPLKLHKLKRIPNMAILLNGTEKTGGYQYGYSYGYNNKEEIVPWYKKINVFFDSIFRKKTYDY